MTPTQDQIQELKEMLAAFIQEPPHHCEKTAEFAAIADKFSDVIQSQAVIIEQLKTISETNKKVVETLYGNGKPGRQLSSTRTRETLMPLWGSPRRSWLP